MVNPDRPWPRPERPVVPLDATASETLELWCAAPEWDTRSIEEFAAEGGRPVGPPNRSEHGDQADLLVGFFAFVWGLPYLLFQFFRRMLALFGPNNSDRGKFYELPPGLELRPLAPAPPPPSTPMLPRAPIGGTGETGRLRASFDWAALGIPSPGGDGRVGTFRGQPVDAGGALIFPFPPNPRPTVSMEPKREDRQALRDELPPVYPDDDDQVTCGECGEKFDPADLDALVYHETGHRPRLASGIRGKKMTPPTGNQGTR